MPLRYLLFIFFSFTGAVAMAQPVITAADFNPVAGDVILNYGVGMFLSQGASGPNAVWDFSSYNGGNIVSSVDTWYACGAGANCGAYPSANIARGNNIPGPYVYYAVTPDSFTQVSTFTLSGINIAYDDPLNLMKYPMTYQDSFTDAATVIYPHNGTLYHNADSMTRVADGYGTLITPMGTYTNALRLHTIERLHTYGAQDTAVFYFRYDAYTWLVPGIHSAVYTIYSDSYTANGTTTFQQGSEYVAEIPAAVPAATPAEAGLKVYPNPATTAVNIDVTTGSKAAMCITLTDITGRTIATIAGGVTEAGQQHYSYPTTGLPRGVYYLRLVSGATNVTRKVEVL